MDHRAEVRDFLISRRAKLTPEDAGLSGGVNRRVAGVPRLRFSPASALSTTPGSSGAHIAGASSSVLDAISRALKLDEAERAHLFDLARAADGVTLSRRARRRPDKQAPSRPALQWTLEAITEGVAFVRNSRMDLLATNVLGRAFYAPMIGDGGRTANLARFQFLDPASHDFYPDWELFAEMCVAVMRAEAGRDPHDRAMQDLVGELSTRSDVFRRLWGAHGVRTHGAGTKRFRHPVVGELVLAYEELTVTADPGLAMLIYTAEPGSPSAERLSLLASWAAGIPSSGPATDDAER